MNYRKPNRLTRQQVADLAQLSYDSLVNNETRLGLDQCKVEVNSRLIFYYEDKAIEVLIEAGLLLTANGTE